MPAPKTHQHSGYPALYFAATNTVVALPQAEGSVLMGRGEHAEICVLDQSCSREQLRLHIKIKPERCVLEHLSQKVPTFLNGDPVSRAKILRHGDLVSFGNTALIYLERDDPSLSTLQRQGSAGPGPGMPDEVQKTVFGDATLEDDYPVSVGEIVLDRDTIIGRDSAQVNIVLDHPRVSRKHAAVQVRAGRVSVRDLRSSNGTFVNGERISGFTLLQRGDRVDIGPYSLEFTGRSFVQSSREGNLRIVARNLVRTVVSADDGRSLRILDDVTLIIEPNDFVCLLGPSGSGKTTLMNALSARAPADSGTVLMNEVSLYANFDALKEGMALVPQHDVLHEELTLEQALSFTARLRLPPDTTESGIQEAVQRALKSVDLEHRASTLIHNLSGGQKKRASLANETVCRPNLLFLDEVTSGLDEGTDWEIMQLFCRMADRGMTVVCVTHTVANVEEFAHKIVVMTSPGVMAFYGTPAEALDFFGVPKPGDIYRKLPERSAEDWRKAYARSAYCRRYVTEPLMKRSAVRSPLTIARRHGKDLASLSTEAGRQFRILVDRLTKIVLADRTTLTIAAVQAILVGVLLPLVFGNASSLETVNPQAFDTKPFSLLFLLGMSCLWFGANNASKEIVKERPIYRRERDVNLSVLSYLLSKVVVQGLVGIAQVLVLFWFVQRLSHVPGSDSSQLIQMIVTVLTGTSMGLLISATTNTRDQANTLVPIALIPQIILGGLIVKDLPFIPDIIAHVFVSGFWVYQGMEAVLKDDDHRATLALCVQGLHIFAFLGLSYLVLLLRDARGDLVYGDAVKQWVKTARQALVGRTDDQPARSRASS